LKSSHLITPSAILSTFLVDFNPNIPAFERSPKLAQHKKYSANFRQSKGYRASEENSGAQNLLRKNCSSSNLTVLHAKSSKVKTADPKSHQPAIKRITISPLDRPTD
jgi:hypothetical protein